VEDERIENKKEGNGSKRRVKEKGEEGVRKGRALIGDRRGRE
jgi:hypothetical protein